MLDAVTGSTESAGPANTSILIGGPGRRAIDMQELLNRSDCGWGSAHRWYVGQAFGAGNILFKRASTRWLRKR